MHKYMQWQSNIEFLEIPDTVESFEFDLWDQFLVVNFLQVTGDVFRGLWGGGGGKGGEG